MTNTVGPAESWRLVHDAQKVICLFKSTGYTESEHTIFEAATKQACLDEIARLGLEYDPDPWDDDEV